MRDTVSKAAASNSRATAGPERSWRKPLLQESLTVITAAVRRCCGAGFGVTFSIVQTAVHPAD